jgi:hypothetical protein
MLYHILNQKNMNNKLFPKAIIVSVMSFLAMQSQAQNLYLKIGGGYGIGSAPSIFKQP